MYLEIITACFGTVKHLLNVSSALFVTTARYLLKIGQSQINRTWSPPLLPRILSFFFPAVSCWLLSVCLTNKIVSLRLCCRHSYCEHAQTKGTASYSRTPEECAVWLYPLRIGTDLGQSDRLDSGRCISGSWKSGDCGDTKGAQNS